MQDVDFIVSVPDHCLFTYGSRTDTVKFYLTFALPLACSLLSKDLFLQKVYRYNMASNASSTKAFPFYASYFLRFNIQLYLNIFMFLQYLIYLSHFLINEFTFHKIVLNITNFSEQYVIANGIKCSLRDWLQNKIAAI